MKANEKAKRFVIIALFLSAVHYVACIASGFAAVFAMPDFDDPAASASPLLPFLMKVTQILALPLSVLDDMPFFNALTNSYSSPVFHIRDFINSALWGVATLLLWNTMRTAKALRKQ